MDKKDLSCAFFEDIISPSYRAGVAWAIIPRISVSLLALPKLPHITFLRLMVILKENEVSVFLSLIETEDSAELFTRKRWTRESIESEKWNENLLHLVR